MQRLTLLFDCRIRIGLYHSRRRRFASKFRAQPIESSTDPMNDQPINSGDLPDKTGQDKSAGTDVGAIPSHAYSEVQELTDPIIARELRKHFHVSLRTDDFSEANQDALEMLSDVRVKLLARFGTVEDEGSKVENLEAYARTAANNAFRDYLRKKYPTRLRLSNRVKYILNASDRLDSWQSDDGDLVCGKNGWRGREVQGAPALPEEIVELLQEHDGALKERSGGKRVRSLVHEFFSHAAGPVPLVLLINVLAEALMIQEPSLEITESGASEIRASTRSVVRRFEDRNAVGRLWGIIRDLPLRHRTAVLLNLRTDNGDNALQLFIALRIATVEELAEAVEMSAQELAGIWRQLPLDDNTIAERLGLTRQQVINLRSSARANLRRKSD